MLIELIKADQLTARKNKNDVARSLLTTLMSDCIMVAKNDGRESPTDSEVVAVVRKFLKSNSELQAVLKDGEPLNVARAEAVYLNRYLPQQLDSDQLQDIVNGAIVLGNEDMKSIMAYLKTNYEGQYDGKMASAIVKGSI